jgi:hypothetical protein
MADCLPGGPVAEVAMAVLDAGAYGGSGDRPMADLETGLWKIVTTSNLIQIRSAHYVFHRNPRTVVAIYIT